MPGFGMIPARGKWETRWVEVLSTATFLKGSLVQLDPAYRAREYASTDSSVFGIALSASTNSRSLDGVNKVNIAIPAPGCTALSDVTTGVVQSALSIGKKVAADKNGNLMSYCSTVIGQASRFSGIFTVVGPIDARTSQVEVAFNMENTVFYSASSTTFAS